MYSPIMYFIKLKPPTSVCKAKHSFISLSGYTSSMVLARGEAIMFINLSIIFLPEKFPLFRLLAMLTDFTFYSQTYACFNVKILLKWQFIVAIYYSKNHLIGSSYMLAVCNARNKRTRTK